MGNREMRAKLAALSFSEKVKVLERLRDRSLAFAAAGLRRGHNLEQFGDNRVFCGCSDWEPCACRHHPPYHCKWCCRELTGEQLQVARQRGFYLKEKR
jgi:hypothetical protein